MRSIRHRCTARGAVHGRDPVAAGLRTSATLSLLGIIKFDQVIPEKSLCPSLTASAVAAHRLLTHPCRPRCHHFVSASINFSKMKSRCRRGTKYERRHTQTRCGALPAIQLMTCRPILLQWVDAIYIRCPGNSYLSRGGLGQCLLTIAFGAKQLGISNVCFGKTSTRTRR
jgi:hypothetical protein